MFYHPKPIRFLLYGLLLLLPVFAVFLGYLAVLQWLLMAYVIAVALGAASVLALLGWVAGVYLAPFIAVKCECSDGGLHVMTAKGEKVYPWHELGPARYDKWLQIVRLYHTNGQLVLAVDYHLVGFKAFTAELSSRGLMAH